MNTLQNEEKCSCGCGHSHHEHHQINDCIAHNRARARRPVKKMLTKRKCTCGCDDDDADEAWAARGEQQSHAHEAEHGGSAGHLRAILLVAGIIAFISALFIPETHIVRLPVFITAYLLLGFEVLWTAALNIRSGKIFDENLLMSISTIGAFGIGEYPEAVAVMLFYCIGESLQDMAAGKSRRSIRALMNLKSDITNLVTDNGIVETAPEAIKPGQSILVKPGERFPLDGIVTEGISQVDTSPLSGEHVPRVIAAGDTVLSGTINLTGVLHVRVTGDYSQSTVAKIIDMVEIAQARKAPAEQFIRKFARVYTPIVVCAAVLLSCLPPLLLADAQWADWVKRALVFLVVSCPCALVVSVPLTFFSGIGISSKKGILVKGGNYLQALSEIDTVVFDKTGTLTKGVFDVTAIHPADGASESDVLQAAFLAEQFSNHPIAKSICAAYELRSPQENNGVLCESYEEIAGRGIAARCGERMVLCGNLLLMTENHIACNAYDGIGSAVYVVVDGRYLGTIIVSDEIREGAALLADALRKQGIRRIIMLTGDRRENAVKLAKTLGIDEVRAELLPDGKVTAIEELYSAAKRCKIAFVGDGINDAPVLARADTGIAMGGIGSDAAVEAADVVLMNDEPLKVAEAIQTAKNTMRIVRQNVAFSLFVKFAVLALAVFGYAEMWLAVFADVGVTLLAVLNAMRKK